LEEKIGTGSASLWDSRMPSQEGKPDKTFFLFSLCPLGPGKNRRCPGLSYLRVGFPSTLFSTKLLRLAEKKGKPPF